MEEFRLKKDKKTQGYRINDQIRAKTVRVIDWSGKPIGIISYTQAMEYAEGERLRSYRDKFNGGPSCL